MTAYAMSAVPTLPRIAPPRPNARAVAEPHRAVLTACTPKTIAEMPIVETMKPV
ncbi:hypothetical protein [Curtobacterium flaccumfaciens]|uniref:hypothetical protein n=1 Tax=Curtobacterium flaccumfaciens TaxID=2035 RepID=UPI002658D460|nr:hypothetical protein [Curtobacterium flaccumfaciens]MCS5507234.1 hypothetical protein [Curtobacterium flaccumfaciens pv. flaccumfaciens]